MCIPPQAWMTDGWRTRIPVHTQAELQVMHTSCLMLQLTFRHAQTHGNTWRSGNPGAGPAFNSSHVATSVTNSADVKYMDAHRHRHALGATALHLALC